MKKINFNSIIKVKLTDYGKDIYYHRFDDLILSGINVEPKMPKEDAGGFSYFILWYFMNIYGKYMTPGQKNVVEDISFYIEDEDLDEVPIIEEPLWTLTNSKHPNFNIWRSKFGYFETFKKDVNPNYKVLCNFDKGDLYAKKM